MNILIADDHAVVRKGLIQILREALFLPDVTEASSGEEVLARLREKKWSIIKIPSLPAGGLTLNKASCYYKRHNTLLSLASMSENMEHTKTGSCGRQGTAIKECRKICSTFKSTDDVMAQKFGDLLAQSYKNIRLFLR